MLADNDAIANIAVKDLAIARRFYEDTLGLRPAGTEGDELVAYRSGNTTVFVYRSAHAGTNRATAVTWVVGDAVASVAAELKARGVVFEHYDDMPGLALQGDLHVGEGMQIAWFKDPDGNILSIVSG